MFQFPPREYNQRTRPFEGLFRRSNMQPHHPFSHVNINHTKQNRQSPIGGLLSRLLQRRRNAYPFPSSSPFVRPTSTPELSTASKGAGLGSIITFLESAQKSIDVAQTFIPMVQQYSPLIKVLPEMMAMLNSEEENSDETKVDEEEQEAKKKESEQSTVTETTEKIKKVTEDPKMEDDKTNLKMEKEKQIEIKSMTEKKNRSRPKPKKKTIGEFPAPKLYI